MRFPKIVVEPHPLKALLKALVRELFLLRREVESLKSRLEKLENE